MNYIPNMLATVRKELQRYKGYWPFIADKAKVSYSFIAHTSSGHTPDPGVVRLQRVLDVLWKIDQGKLKLPE